MGEGNKRKEQSEEQSTKSKIKQRQEMSHIRSSERQTEADPESCRPQKTRRKPSY